ncbi:MAG: helix-turn-helix domain-containing protein [Chitinophagaceae bacterium]|nr:helix-turn-helix domain-containing protein [Chitinophagaceae bacterium]
MKVLQFTIPVAHDKSFIIQKDVLPHFYPHLHRHTEVQLTWVQKGEGTLIVENNMHTFWTNDIYWIGGNQPHVFKSASAYPAPKSRKTVQTLSIYFSPFEQLSALFSLHEFKKIKNFAERAQSGFKLPEDAVGEASSWMLKIQNSKGVNQFTNFIGLLNYIQSIQNLQPLVSGTRLSQVNEQEGIRIGNIYDYIMKHFDEEITLEAISKHANMTPQAFCRYFKKHTRLTFVSFLNEVRINEACKKLSEGSYDSISTIAYHCGFNSIANFNRVFRAITKKSPREYIREFDNLPNQE